ncbi:MAG: low molecular weight protein-tyrosine-phosphatase [Methylotetracoccus sp.]
MFERILMVCVGNICRSPLAAALWNRSAGEAGLVARAESAGLAAPEGAATHPIVLRLLAESGTPSPESSARPLSVELLNAADLILVMESWHAREIERRLPYLLGRVFTLGHWDGAEIQDPYNEPEAVFRSVYTQIERGVDAWIEKLNAERP